MYVHARSVLSADFGESEIDFGGSNGVDISCITLEDSGDVGVTSEETTNQNVEPMDGMSTHNQVTHAQTHTHIHTAEELDTLLGATETRAFFINDLLEMKEFLTQRLHELSHETTSSLAIGQVPTHTLPDSPYLHIQLPPNDKLHKYM